MFTSFVTAVMVMKSVFAKPFCMCAYIKGCVQALAMWQLQTVKQPFAHIAHMCVCCNAPVADLCSVHTSQLVVVV